MLSTAQLQDALDYNDTRTYSTRLWQAIQREADATPDGIPGPQTARQVALWQLSAGIKVDGMAGPQTLKAMRLEGMLDPAPEPNGCGKVQTLGIWWDLGPGWSVRDADIFAAELADMGVDVVGLMADRSHPAADGGPDWRWTPAAAHSFATALHAKGIQVDIVSWPRPTLRYLTGLHVGIAELIKATNARVYQLDLEGNWEDRDVDGFDDLDQAAEQLLDSARQCNVDLAVTTFLYHGEHSPASATVSPHVGKLIPQAYASYREHKPSEHWGKPLGPGGHQRATFKRVGKVLADQATMAMGLPAYGQNYPEIGTEKAMRTQLEAALKGGAREIWYWSSKWLMNRSKQQSRNARAFFEQIKARYG